MLKTVTNSITISIKQVIYSVCDEVFSDEMSCLKIQVRTIALTETAIAICLLTLNLKILVELIIRKNEIKQEELGEFRNLSVSALILFFLIRVIYLIGELILAIFLNIWVYKENANGLIMWFTVTILFSIASRCYFIGGIIWGNYFLITVITFSANLAFTLYSLIIVCCFLKQITATQDEESREYVSSFYEMV